MKLRNKFFVLRNEDDADDIDSSSGSGAVGTGNDARVALLNAIGNQNDNDRAEELQDVGDGDVLEPFIPEEVIQTKTEDEDPVVKPEVQDTTPEPVSKHKIKVNGQELESTLEELIARAQKVESADQYLAQAKKAIAPAPQVPAKPQPSAEDVERESIERDRALVRAIQVGNEDEAVAAIRAVRESARPSEASPDDVARITDERLELKSAMDWFATEFKDLVEDPQMKAIVEERDDQLVSDGDRRPYRDRFEQIGKEVRAWRDSLVQKYAPKPEPVQDLKSKEQKKAAAPSVPRAASSTAKPAPEPDDQEESASAVIANMARSCGGPQWMQPRA